MVCLVLVLSIEYFPSFGFLSGVCVFLGDLIELDLVFFP